MGALALSDLDGLVLLSERGRRNGKGPLWAGLRCRTPAGWFSPGAES